MKLLFLNLFFLLVSIPFFAQKHEVINNESVHFQLLKNKDTIDFIVVDSVLTVKKPIFLFCQGSNPMPLYVNLKDEGKILLGGGVRNFDVDEIKKKYHIIVISMPKTPFCVGENQINNEYCYVPDSSKNEYSIDFFKANYVDNYVNRANEVLKYLRKQNWVDNSKLVVVGHSQGSKIAAKIALTNKHVTQVGLFGANPFGRIDQMIRTARLNAQLGIITWKEADEEMEYNYNKYRAACDPVEIQNNPHLSMWKSFSDVMVYDWLKIKAPIYLAYGTEDRVTDLCDIVPIFFIQAGNENLTMKRYLHLEHNFFEVEEDGKVNYDKGHWKEVMNEFLKWTNK